MNQEISGFKSLSETLLSQIGLITGNALIKVSFLNSSLDEIIVKELLQKCRLTLKDKLETNDSQKLDSLITTDGMNETTHGNDIGINVIETTDSKVMNGNFASNTRDMSINSPVPLTWEEKVDLKIVKVFPIPVEELPESFYEITSVEARNFVKLPEVEMLKTKFTRDREAKEKADKYPTVIILEIKK